MKNFLLFITVLSYFDMALSENISGFADTTPGIESNHLYPVILDGRLAQSSDSFARYTVQVQAYSVDRSRLKNCTGVIIAEDMILTAGHCFESNGQNVTVRFGLAGENKFEWTFKSTMYSALFKNQFFFGPLAASREPKVNEETQVNKPPSTTIVEGKLNINYNEQKLFYKKIENRQSLLNYANIKRDSDIDLNLTDYAVVRISKLPPGYQPIPFYQGTYEFGQDLYYVGYGRNHIENNKNQLALRWSKAHLIGHYTRSNDITKGFQVYSKEKKTMCFGDSGGPLIVKADGIDYLVGINNFVFNRCAEDTWHLNIHYYLDSINEMMRVLRSLHSI